MNLLNFAQQIGLSPKWMATTQGAEYKSACPECGGKDRFVIQPNRQQKNCLGSFFCRKCGINGDTIQFCMNHLGYSFKEAVDLLGTKTTEKSSLLFMPKLHRIPNQVISQPNEIWIEQATAFVTSSHTRLLNKPNTLDYLHKRGISLEMVVQYQLGYLDKDTYHMRTDLGLSEERKENGEWRKLWLPSGIVIPTMESDKIVRLKVRRSDWMPDSTYPKYVAISGSMSGLNIIGNKKKSIMVITESELDMYALHHAVNDFACIVSIGGSTKDPDPLIDRLANKKTVLVCHDQDDGGLALYSKWKQLYPHAQASPTPMGKDIGEAVKLGLDLRIWVISLIPKQMQYDLKLIKHPWSVQDLPLIDWVLHYVQTQTSTPQAYQKILAEIELGPNSPRAKNNLLQIDLLLMKELAETEFKQKGTL